MTRRKSVCSKWTLVLLVVILCEFVDSRPQEVTSPSPVNDAPTNNVQTTESTRYRFRYKKRSLTSLKLPVVISFLNNSDLIKNSHSYENGFNRNSTTPLKEDLYSNAYLFKTQSKEMNSHPTRQSRLVKSKGNGKRKKIVYPPIKNDNTKNNIKIVNHKNNLKISQPVHDHKLLISHKSNPPIRKIVTKWRDEAKYEDLHLNLDTAISNENTFNSDHTSTELNDEISTESTEKQNSYQSFNHLYNKLVNNRYKPKPEYSEETQVYSSNVHIIDRYPFPSVRPTYVFTTPMPTPIITNVGNPQPWPQPSFQNDYRKTTRKPMKTKNPIKNQHNYHNSVYNNYPQNNFEVTTFQPSTAYTDRIVIRPEEYSASPDDCPTIFLSLNNTFQGQGKEACPDLNIAVNTNVINKNVVIETEEEDAELFPGPFDEPIDDDSETDSAQANDYFESEENEEQEDASVEGESLTNYNAANQDLSSDSPEASGFGSSSTNLASLHKPSKPSSDLDDLFSFSGFFDFFRPSLNALNWLVSLSPFNFGLLSFFFSPIAMIFAAAYGVASFFSSLPFAREAPKVQVYRPEWQWDDNIKTWHLNSFPGDRNWNKRIPKNSQEVRSSVKPTLFFKLKEWMKRVTNELREKNELEIRRRHNRKKREAWARRVK